MKKRLASLRPHLAALLVASGLLSCVNGRLPDEALTSAFDSFVHDLDTLQQEQALRAVVKADSLRLTEADRAVRDHYADAHAALRAPHWYSRAGLSPEAEALLVALRRSLPQAGLDTAAFRLPQIAADLFTVRALAFDSVGQGINEVLPRLEYLLTRAYVKYTAGQRYGFMRPAAVFNRLDTKPDGGLARLFDYDVKAPDYARSLRQLDGAERMDFLEKSEPQQAEYKVLKRALATETDSARRHKLAVNMERLRWQMEQPAAAGRQIIVNLPAQQLWALGNDTALTMRICCGATVTKTPLLHSAISYFQVNPDWIIPTSIIKNEVSLHAGDSAYFARHRYYIVDTSRGDTLNPATVTASQLRTGGLRVGQDGGRGNSLGRIVFRFPNNFSVYLHDTSNHGAFALERRTLSHGCVRVEKPFELARYLLPAADDWTLDRLRISMDLPPKTEQGRAYLRSHADDPRPLRLIKYRDVAPTVPIFIVYRTAWVDPVTGAIAYWPDLYGYDAVVSRHAPVR